MSENTVTINSMYLIKMKNENHFYTEEVALPRTIHLENLITEFVNNHKKNQLSELEISENYNQFRVDLEKIDPEFFNDTKDYCRSINKPYTELSWISRTFVQQSSPGELEKQLRYYYQAHRIKKAISGYQNDDSVRAYSFRIRGFNSIDFILNEDFTIKMGTNFGYGKNSYFQMTLKYKNISIIPYSSIIFYSISNKISFHNFTRQYNLIESEWRNCFNFTVEVINEFYTDNREVFIHKHITNSLEEMLSLLEVVVKNKRFLLIKDLKKLNAFLSVPDKQIIYDYDTLLNSDDASSIIDFDIIDKIVTLHMHQPSIPISSYNDYIENIIKEPLNTPLQKDQYAYAIITYLDRTYPIKISEQLKKEIVKLILPQYEHSFYLMSDYDLQIFRSNTIISAINFIDNIQKLNDLIDPSKYIQGIKKNAEKIVAQNNSYVNQLKHSMVNLEKNQRDKSDQLNKANKKLERSKSFQNYGAFEKWMKFLNTLNTIKTLYANESKEFDVMNSLQQCQNQYSELITYLKKSNVKMTDLIWDINPSSTMLSNTIKICRENMVIPWHSNNDLEEIFRNYIEIWDITLKEVLEKFSKMFDTQRIYKFLSIRLMRLIEIEQTFITDSIKTIKSRDLINIYIEAYKENHDRFHEIYRVYEKQKTPIMKQQEELNTLRTDIANNKKEQDKLKKINHDITQILIS